MAGHTLAPLAIRAGNTSFGIMTGDGMYLILGAADEDEDGEAPR